MSVKNRIAQLNTRLADTLTEKGVQADGSETTTALIGKVAQIQQGGETGIDLFSYIQLPPQFDSSISEVTEDITLHMEKATSVIALLDLCTINAPKVTLYISDKCANMFRVLRHGSGLNTEGLRTVEIVGDTSKITQYGAAFFNRSTLETINCEFDFSSATNVVEMFLGCTGLKEVRIAPRTLSLSMSFKDSERLSVASLQSIIDGLADLTGGTSQVLSLHINTKSQMTDEQIAAVTGKNWTIA